MTFPGVKFRSGAWNRWLTPQLHETLFRQGGAGAFAGGIVDESTILVGVSSASSTGGVSTFTVPANALHAGLIIAISARGSGAGSTVTSVTWNSVAFTKAIEAIHPGADLTTSLWYQMGPAVSVTDDIDVVFSAVVLEAVCSAYVVNGIANTTPDVFDDAFATNAATVSVPLTTSVANDLVLDALGHIYTISTPSPAPTAAGQISIIVGDDGAGLMGGSSYLPVAVAGAVTPAWGSMDASSSFAVQVAAAFKPFVAATPPAVVLSTLKQRVGASSNVNNMTNFAVPATGGPYLIIAAWESNVTPGNTVTAVTWNSRNFTFAAGKTDVGAIGTRSEIWYLLTADLGVSSTISVSWGPTNDATALIAYCVEGVKMQAPEATATNDSASKPINTSITTITAGALILDGAGAATTSASSITQGGAGQVYITQQAVTSDGLSCSYRIGGAPGSHTLGWDYVSASNRNPHVVVAFEKA